MEDDSVFREREEKVRKYESFIDEKLRKDLSEILNARDHIYDQIASYLDLRNKIHLIQEEQLKEMKTMINLGSEFYIHASIPDTSVVFVNVGLGFQVEFSLGEALQFIETKEKYLSEFANGLTLKASILKTQIKMMYRGIAELMNLDLVDRDTFDEVTSSPLKKKQ